MLTDIELRDGIFALNTRRFGTIAEFMIKRIANLGSSKNQFHDLYDDFQNKRVEVKFSKVQKKEDSINENNILDCIKGALSSNRSINFANWQSFKFDCLIISIVKAWGRFMYTKKYQFHSV